MDADSNLDLPPYSRAPRRRTPRDRRPRKRVWFPLLALVFLSPVIYSWGQMMRLPSSETVFPRTVEWIRQHHFNWLVNDVEYYYNTWFHTPTSYTNVTPSTINGARGNLLLSAMVVGRIEHHGAALRFRVKDIGGKNRARIWVDYSGTAPKHFRAGDGIQVSGSVNGGTFTATPNSLQMVVTHQPQNQHHHTGSYRPPNIKPVFRYALAQEGVWRQTGPPVAGGPPVLVTTFRPETNYPQITAYVAWFDHTRTASAYYPGTYEPPPPQALPGPHMVPYSQRWRLLSTFNGGFIYTDGLNGDGLNGVTNEPLKKGNATAVGYKNGNVDIIDWTGGPTLPNNMAWARQSLPPIVNHGKLNPKLNLSTDWGYTLGNAVRVWRSGLGIDKHGNFIYVAASYQTVITLAKILKRAGAVRAMELDINPEWYTLITYRHNHGLVPYEVAYNYQQPPTRYLKPDDRDFFAIYKRLSGPITVPLK